MDTRAILTGAVILVTAVSLGWMATEKYRADDPYQNRQLMKKGQELPPIWIYVNNSDVNSRSWADFMSRSGRALNLPFLNLCYQTIVQKNFEDYRVEVIGGLEDLAVRMGGWEALPEPLRRVWCAPAPGSGEPRLAIDPELQAMVRFRELNLMGDWPMQRPFDVIFCRNVMIYFDLPTKERLIERFARQLAAGGYLYIGHSERVSGPATALLEPVGPTIYRRKD